MTSEQDPVVFNLESCVHELGPVGKKLYKALGQESHCVLVDEGLNQIAMAVYREYCHAYMREAIGLSQIDEGDDET